ncbi:(Lyso)-N-acylphosphatidylethanolamine lipase-like isoform X1 [Diorhabda carinulata]|uniref:(Lyso)-N-acylphosphatidylethanolamine lipase-like isoform X1 n=2 Tax=Diorhabda carinulata TaxID=1163345 RepID=UPI0025A2A5C1|nr:(Lyso)-N-acylphosphatidylethanolamine lipase-like isoform X1 [Diorhabda carinulata]
METEMTETDFNSGRCGYWTKFSETKLIQVEKKILNVLKTAYRTWFVPIGSTVGKDDKIWTIALNEESHNTPLVMLHGFAAGLCFWILNFDELSKNRPVYAIDLLGFGRSSRPKFNSNSQEAEQQMVASIEEWRKQMQLERFILLGHSFGGYLATSYAITYPDRVKHLILADPWGFQERPAKLNVPLAWKLLAVVFYPLTWFNPLAGIRAAGPMGPWLVSKVRNDISAKYSDAVDNTDLITEYIYHCNTQKPSGEAAFHSMKQGIAWAKNPMMRRYHTLSKTVPLTVIYGEKSWVRKTPTEDLIKQRPQSYVRTEIIPNAGHHINADQPTIFNQLVSKVCQLCDNSEDIYIESEDKDNPSDPIFDVNEWNKKNEFLIEEDEFNGMQVINTKL